MDDPNTEWIQKFAAYLCRQRGRVGQTDAWRISAPRAFSRR